MNRRTPTRANTSCNDSSTLDEQPAFPLVNEFVEDTAEYTDAGYKQKIATLDFVLKLQHEYIVKLGICCIMDRLQKRKGQGIRKTLLRDTRRCRDANKERHTRILERMEDQQNERFLNASLVGAENTGQGQLGFITR